MNKEEKYKKAINELADSYELHLKQWAKRCIDTINEYTTNLQQENKKQKEVIDKAIEYVEGHKYTMKHYEPYGTPTGLPNYETHNIKGYHQLLDILKEVSE